MRTLLLLLLVGIALTVSGCGVVLHPILKSDIFRMKTGTSYSSEKDGWFISDLYMKEVMKAKVSVPTGN